MSTSKYIKKVQPTNKKNEFLDGEEIEFELPNNKVDITSFKIFYQAKADPIAEYSDGSYLKRFMPRISASIISELILVINGETKQHIKDYNRLHNIINDGLYDTDPIDSNRYDTLNFTGLDATNRYITECDFVNNTGITKEPLYYEYFIVNLLGFITEGHQIIDLTNNQVKIKIVLAPPHICYSGLRINTLSTTVEQATELRYAIKDIHATIDCYTIDVPIKKDITFKDYKTFYGSVTDNKNINMLIHHTGNVNYIICSFIDKNANTHTGLQLQHCNSDSNTFDSPIQANINNLNDTTIGIFTPKTCSVENIRARCTENLLNNSLYFKRNGLTVKSCQLVHNGMDITPHLNMSQLFLNAKEFFNGNNNRVKSISSFENEFFVLPYNFNVRDNNFKNEITWVVQSYNVTDINGGIPIIFLCYDKTITLK